MIRKQETSLKNAVIINAVSKYAKVLVNLVYTAILARILSPEDYGIVAVITVFTTFFALFSDMGLSTAVIQNKMLTNDEVNDIFSFTIYLGVGLAIFFCLFSFPLSAFYDDRVYISAGMLLSVALLFNTLNMIPNALLMKERQFVLVAVRTIAITVIGAIVTIICAVSGLKYYSVVTNSILTAVLTYFANIRGLGLKFHIRIRRSSIKKVWGFSMFQFGFNIVNYFSRNLDNLLIGKFMGSGDLGYYDKAYKLMQYPTSNLTHVITPALHPILSDYQDNKEYIYEKYILIVRFLCMAGVFVSSYCFFASEEIIALLYGPGWKNSVICFSWLSISIWAQMITSSSGAIFQSLGDTKRMFIVGGINAFINVLCIVLGVLKGDIVYVAMSVGICYNIHFLSTYVALIHFSFEKSFIKFLFELKKEFCVGIFLVISVRAFRFSIEGIFLSAVLKFLYLGLVFSVMLLITKDYLFLIKLIGPISHKMESKSDGKRFSDTH